MFFGGRRRLRRMLAVPVVRRRMSPKIRIVQGKLRWMVSEWAGASGRMMMLPDFWHEVTYHDR